MSMQPHHLDEPDDMPDDRLATVASIFALGILRLRSSRFATDSSQHGLDLLATSCPDGPTGLQPEKG